MIHVRVICDYPADPISTGWPAETTDVTTRLPSGWAPSAAEAHSTIQALIEAGEAFEIPSADPEPPFRFSPDVVREVRVWGES